MTSVSKIVYIDKLDDIFNKYNNTNHSTIKLKPNTYIDFNEEKNDKNPKFTAVYKVKISKEKNILAKSYSQN